MGLSWIGRGYKWAKKTESPIKKIDKLVKDLDKVDTKKYVDEDIKLGPIWKKTKTGAKVVAGSAAATITYGKIKQKLKKKKDKKDEDKD
jgi:hypothetical protein